MTVLVLAGPTASGKSDLALKLAHSLPLEIISMDSMAVYKNCPIVTAQPDEADRLRVPHHLMDFLDISQEFSVGEWHDRVWELVDDIRSRQRMPLIVGGSFLYLQSLVKGLNSLPPADEALRLEHRRLFDEQGPDVLWKQLEEVDPESAQKLHPNDFKRVSRALEIMALTGTPRSEHFNRSPKKMPCTLMGLTLSRERLYERCHQRVQHMLEQGLVDEIRQLMNQDWGPTFSQAVGVAEVRRHLEEAWPVDDMVGMIEQRTRHLAKHQQTWMKHFDWSLFEAEADDVAERVLEFCQVQIAN